jgi:hypothetical protein
VAGDTLCPEMPTVRNITFNFPSDNKAYYANEKLIKIEIPKEKHQNENI